MKGYWISGTHKFQHHYQSGKGGDTFVLSDMQMALLGFQYDRSSEAYHDLIPVQRFYTDSQDNISIANTYKLWSGTPTRISEELNVPIVYDVWQVINGQIKVGQNPRYRWIVQMPIWRYGEITGEPLWAYGYQNGSPSYMIWDAQTETSQSSSPYVMKNQDGIVRPSAVSYFKPPISGGPTFESEYNGMTIKVVVPVYELVAVPNDGENGTRFVLTDGNNLGPFPNQIRLKGIPKKGTYDIARVPTSYVYSASSVNSIIGYYTETDQSGNTYMMQPITRVSQLGALGFGDGYFAGDKLFIFITEGDANNGYHRKVAGQYTDPVSGARFDMIYAMRLVRLEAIDIEPSTAMCPIDMHV